MLIKSKLTGCIAAILVLAGSSADILAQSSSLNTYSPYTLYGIGDIGTQGPASMRSMGGIGTAYRSRTRINNLNPASYSAMPRKSALFSVGVEGQNAYLSEGDKSTSHNSFNIRDLSLQLPVYKGVGFGFSMTPYSRIGYNISNRISNGMIGSEIGSAAYTFEGSGNITQFKAGIGWAITDYLSVGADIVYYHGKISRDFNAIFTPYTTGQVVTNLTGYKSHRINTFLGMFGVQAEVFSKEEQTVTLGATYRMGGTLRGTVTKEVPTALLTTVGGNAIYIEDDSQFRLADTYTLGVIYRNGERFMMGADYSFSNWSVNESGYSNINYRDTHTAGVGFEFTPNARDIRRYFNRVSYRLGGRYSQYYIDFSGHSINECAVSFGMGFPLNTSRSQNIDVGIEAGMRGKNSDGLIKEQFIRLSVSFSMFGTDYWFTRPRYD